MSQPSQNPLPHVMVDVETLALKEDAAIVWLGAVVFTHDGEDALKNGFAFADHFTRLINIDSNLRAGRRIDGKTLKWWHAIPQLWEKVVYTPDSQENELRKVLNDFREWLPKPCYMWSNGANFDLRLLTHCYTHSLKQNVPWLYKHERDTRTLWAMAGRDEPTRPITHHPTWDAWAQAVAVIRAWRKLGVTGDVGT